MNESNDYKSRQKIFEDLYKEIMELSNIEFDILAEEFGAENIFKNKTIEKLLIKRKELTVDI